MQNNAASKKALIGMIVFLVLFVALLAGSFFVDRAAIGPEGSVVPFSTLNQQCFEGLGGYHAAFYKITQYVGYLPIALALLCCFGALINLIRAKSLKKMEPRFLWAVLACVVIGACYVLFGKMRVTLRPVILDAAEGLEDSFPSTHCLIAVGVFGCALTFYPTLTDSLGVRLLLFVLTVLLMAFIVLGRLYSGVHWVSDIAAGCCLGAAIACGYRWRVTKEQE